MVGTQVGHYRIERKLGEGGMGAKDVGDRYQSAKDLRNDLRALKNDLTSGEIVPTAPANATWTPDREALIYHQGRAGVGTIFRQPLAGAHHRS